MGRRRLLTALLFLPFLAGLNAAAIPGDTAAVRHALNRLGYGPRPGDVERVTAMGLTAWIDRQLQPAAIDDSAWQPRLPLPAAPQVFTTPQEARRAARQSINGLAQERLLRATYSERQLEEVLVDFWFNHFNVFAGKGRTAGFLADYERDAIRPHVLGNFRELLGATAHHPAMLFYLDNWMSVEPGATIHLAGQRGQARRPTAGANGAPVAPQPAGRRRGLNENYGRELLELHTLGVDGGYTQQDVVDVARAFTGWTIGAMRPNDALMRAGAADADQFRFTPAMHDRGAKVVLGQTIRAGGGIEDGERVLDILAAHPSTATHIATKLAQRFVSDTPPASLIARAAARFTATRGDLREVVRTIVTSDEFFAAAARDAKVKTPLEFVVSAVRASGSDRPNTMVMMRGLQQLGMPLYMCQPPTGYDDTAEAWIGPGALVTRINLAQQLAGTQATLVATPEFQRR